MSSALCDPLPPDHNALAVPHKLGLHMPLPGMFGGWISGWRIVQPICAAAFCIDHRRELFGLGDPRLAWQHATSAGMRAHTTHVSTELGIKIRVDAYRDTRRHTTPAVSKYALVHTGLTWAWPVQAVCFSGLRGLLVARCVASASMWSDRGKRGRQRNRETERETETEKGKVAEREREREREREADRSPHHRNWLSTGWLFSTRLFALGVCLFAANRRLCPYLCLCLCLCALADRLRPFATRPLVPLTPLFACLCAALLIYRPLRICAALVSSSWLFAALI
eukprot:1058114-Rhodomonas_salina.2